MLAGAISGPRAWFESALLEFKHSGMNGQVDLFGGLKKVVKRLSTRKISESIFWVWVYNECTGLGAVNDRIRLLPDSLEC